MANCYRWKKMSRVIFFIYVTANLLRVMGRRFIDISENINKHIKKTENTEIFFLWRVSQVIFASLCHEWHGKDFHPLSRVTFGVFGTGQNSRVTGKKNWPSLPTYLIYLFERVVVKAYNNVLIPPQIYSIQMNHMIVGMSNCGMSV